MKNYIVTLAGTIPVDTTVAVKAKDEREARLKALRGVNYDTRRWLHSEHLTDTPTVSDIREETKEDPPIADQMHIWPDE